MSVQADLQGGELVQEREPAVGRGLEESNEKPAHGLEEFGRCAQLVTQDGIPESGLDREAGEGGALGDALGEFDGITELLAHGDEVGLLGGSPDLGAAAVEGEQLDGLKLEFDLVLAGLDEAGKVAVGERGADALEGKSGSEHGHGAAECVRREGAQVAAQGAVGVLGAEVPALESVIDEGAGRGEDRGTRRILVPLLEAANEARIAIGLLWAGTGVVERLSPTLAVEVGMRRIAVNLTQAGPPHRPGKAQRIGGGWRSWLVVDSSGQGGGGSL